MAGFFDPDDLTWWREHWKDMPEFSQDDLTPHRILLVHFYTQEDVDEFARLVEQKITGKTKFLWFPAAEKVKLRELGWFDES